MKKKLKVIITIIFICFIIMLGLISYSSKILNPFVGLNAIIKMELSTEKAEKISDKPIRYISRGYDDFKAYMESKGYTVDQLGRCFDLKKGSERITLESEGFMKYELFTKR